MTAISVQEIAKTFGRGGRQVQALRGVSLDVPRGQIFGLLGRNGAGKTTLVKILLDLVRPSAGRARILDVPSTQARARRPVGYLPEDHRFPGYQTGAGTLRFHARLAGMPRAGLAARIGELLERVDLAEAGGRKVQSYSKGMKQRLGLAQALIHQPEVLFLDEPTDGVDPVGRARIRRLLERLREEGKTIFLNSHLLGEVEQVCDRVAILDQGKLVREGTMEELTAQELVYTLRTEPALSAEQQAALRPLVTHLNASGATLEVGLASHADVDAVVDLLRRLGVGLRALQGKRSTLEEVFLDALGGAGAEDA